MGNVASAAISIERTPRRTPAKRRKPPVKEGTIPASPVGPTPKKTAGAASAAAGLAGDGGADSGGGDGGGAGGGGGAGAGGASAEAVLKR